MEANFEFRKKMHDKILKDRAKISIDHVNKGFYDPIFVHDVNAEVLDELGIKYFLCEYDSREAILSVAKKFNCPVITNKIDYCVYGVSCIPVNSLHFNEDEKLIKCKIYKKDDCANHFKLLKDVKPLFIMLTDEGSVQFQLLSELFTFQAHNLIPALLDWLNSKKRDDVVKSVTKLINREEEQQSFMNTLDEVSQLIGDPKHNLAIKHFLRSKKYWGIFKDDSMWFTKAVSFRRISVPYINLKFKNQYSGCWLIYDENKDDAMLVAIDIISYVHCIISNSQKSSLTFIGRQSTKTCQWNIEKSWDIASDTALFETIVERNKLYGRNMFHSMDAFNLFINKTMPGFNLGIFFTLHKDCWILIITLVYYVNRNRHFVKGAYSILLSYIVLNRVASGVSILNNMSVDLIKDKDLPAYKDCKQVSELIKDMFIIKDLSQFNRSVLHDFAEFQHCLQHMNYLNKICGEKINCTKFYTTFNGTFVYNIYQVIKDADDPLETLTQFVGRSYVFMWYKKLVFAFDKILSSVMSETDKVGQT